VKHVALPILLVANVIGEVWPNKQKKFESPNRLSLELNCAVLR